MLIVTCGMKRKDVKVLALAKIDIDKLFLKDM